MKNRSLGPLADVPSLQTFVAVARHGTVGRAAGCLSRTQPSISARLAALEAAWGTRLFRRGPRGMLLTPEGSRLLPRVEAILGELAELDRAAGLPLAREAILRVGAGDALGRERLPRALARLLASHPQLEVRLREGSGPQLLEALRAGEIDLALVVGRPDGGRAGAVEVEPLIESEIELLEPSERPQRGRREVDLASLGGARFVSLQPGSSFRRHVEAAFNAVGLPFRPAVEVGNLSLVRRFVAAGLGVALVPAVAFPRRSPTAGVERRPVRGLQPVQYHAVVRAGAPRPPTIELLLRQIRPAR